MLTLSDLENKVFKRVKFKGYDIEDVESFMERIINDYEMLMKQNSEMKEKLTKAEELSKYYESLEEGVSQTIENTNKAADEIKEEALREAEEIRNSAKTEAGMDLEQIKLEIRGKELEFEQLKKQIQIYKIKVNSMLEAQMKILKEDENAL